MSSTVSTAGDGAPVDAEPGDAGRLRELLLDAEQRAAAVPQLRERIAELEAEAGRLRDLAVEAQTQARGLDERLMQSEQVLVDVLASPSWQVTRPLRRAKQLLK